MIEMIAFLEGWKPAIYIGEKDVLRWKETKPELLTYPRIMDKSGYYLFFQTEEQKNHYIQNLDSCKDRVEKERLFGLTLGYPPKAVDWFSKTFPYLSLPEEERKKRFEQFRLRVLIDYLGIKDNSRYPAGFGFASSVYDIKENIEWLWKNIKMPEDRKPVIAVKYITGNRVLQVTIQKQKTPIRVPDYVKFTIEYKDYPMLKAIQERVISLVNSRTCQTKTSLGKVNRI